MERVFTPVLMRAEAPPQSEDSEADVSGHCELGAGLGAKNTADSVRGRRSDVHHIPFMAGQARQAGYAEQQCSNSQGCTPNGQVP